MKISQELLKAAKHHAEDEKATGVCRSFYKTEASVYTEEYFVDLFLPLEYVSGGYWLAEPYQLDDVVNSRDSEELRNRRVLALLFAREIALMEGK